METRLEALQEDSVARRRKLFVSLELSASKWLLAASDGARVSEHAVNAGDGAALWALIERSRERFGLSGEAKVVSCYEAGRDGFWLHRFLSAQGVSNLVVDSASIEVNRRLRRAKTDRLDVRKLLGMLMRHEAGETGVWSVLRVPSEQDEDARRAHRERERLLKERTAHRVRIKGLLVLHNLRLSRVGGAGWAERLQGLGVPERLRAELEREAERLELLERQLKRLQAEGAAQPHAARVKQQRLMQLLGVGPVGSQVLTGELFAWRGFSNRRELAASVGLVPTPYASGESAREQGISKAGNRRVRAILIELAWSWLRYQPDSALTRWYVARFAHAGARSRRVGIVALARRLLIALWRFVEQGVVPQGAKLKAS